LLGNKKITGFPWPVLYLQYSSKHKENGDIFSIKPHKKERKIVSGNALLKFHQL